MDEWMNVKKIKETLKARLAGRGRGWNSYRNDKIKNLRKPCKGDIIEHVEWMNERAKERL
jgi:hypothetical protein